MTLLPWHKIQTVLLDMDGTLLDLHFDTQFWREHIPRKLSEKSGKSLEACRQDMKSAYEEVYGQIQWYCLDYWAQRLDLDIMSAKRELTHLIQIREDCMPFLDALKQSQREVVLVTNAHPDSLSLKLEKTQLDAHIDTLISTHQFGVTKESQSLWQQLHAHLDFDPAHTLFVDDSQRILDAAKAFGIAYTLGITNPDSKEPENVITGHPSTNNYHDIICSIIEDNFMGHEKTSSPNEGKA
ncbi:GMP/IMP nucleotidase [Ningiella sp. W23]|uniref:GMP/IMP nucleotidase n=1 Tax=Ningiella sp. W23 TaxID=3023715 RepID=UPI00375704AC